MFKLARFADNGTLAVAFDNAGITTQGRNQAAGISRAKGFRSSMNEVISA